jgi:hypothetical protein
MSARIPEAIPVAAAPPRGPWGWLALFASILTAAGAILIFAAGEGQVATIRATKFGMLPEGIVEAPDYFVNAVTKKGKTLTTNGYDDVPIGNGLDFKLPAAVELEEIAHVDLLDRDVVSHDLLDRVDVRGRNCRGQIYEFEFIGPPSTSRKVGYGLAAGGGAVLVLAAIMLVRSHVI